MNRRTNHDATRREFLAASAAHAHTALKTSSPAEAATVAAPVKELVLEFGGDVRLTAVSLTAADGAKKAVGDVPTAIAAKFTVPVRDEAGKDIALGDASLMIVLGNR